MGTLSPETQETIAKIVGGELDERLLKVIAAILKGDDAERARTNAGVKIALEGIQALANGLLAVIPEPAVDPATGQPHLGEVARRDQIQRIAAGSLVQRWGN